MDNSRLSDIAKQYLIFDDGQGDIQLVRRIQQARGERACFATSDVKRCDRFHCPWRTDCLQKLAESENTDL